MDLGDCAEDWPDDAALGVDESLDDSVFENAPCGICLDVVIDRGVLDCCDHWFCFACIDNWATITNLCPTCKKEFRLITCLPVYDSIGNTRVDDHSLSWDEDWQIQGNSKTLSFPSYYINEDAVICLDGDGCRIRNNLPTEEELNLDTSIACDSCDVWYHAFCVGFDPEDTSHSSWLCPRCENDSAQQRLDFTSDEDLSSDHEQTNTCDFLSAGSILSGKVSISVVDAGETAVIVSLVGGNQFNEEGHHEVEACASVFDQDDDQFLVVNAADNQNSAEFSSDGAPETAVIHGSEPGVQFFSPSPKEKPEEALTMQPTNDWIDQSLESQTGESSTLLSLPKGLKFHQTVKSEDAALDIMSIVQSSKTEEKRLRMKKIMWRSSCDDESSSLIQKLQKEIRETVCDKNISDISKAFDGKLLSAFRAAISGLENMNVDKVDASSQRARNILLHKGKIRENLAKKVYSTASGRRKRAWDRDLTVEFWKQRCLNGKPEKVQTLKSVLDLLKKVQDPNTHIETEQTLESETDNSLLSRLYLADMSVLPRTETIKPLSALTDKKPENSLEHANHNKRLKVCGNASMKAQSNGIKIARKGNELAKESVVGSYSSKTDKRQWALEVLARKSSSSNSGLSQSREEDHFLKGNYPLLAQMPLERRPVPAYCSHSKIPISVRQAQLYRLAEYFLTKVDEAEVELAIADAVNIEKEICMRAKSKIVYVNICSQRMVHGRTSKTENVELTVRPVDQTPEEVNAGCASTDSAVEEILRLAGLLSDSPPESPQLKDNPLIASGDDGASHAIPALIAHDKACDLEKSGLCAVNLNLEVRPLTQEGFIRKENQKVNGHPVDDLSVASRDAVASDSQPDSVVHGKSCNLEKSELCIENLDVEVRPLTELNSIIPKENQEINDLCRLQIPDPDSSVSVDLYHDDRLDLRDDSHITVLEGKNDKELSSHGSEVNLPVTGSLNLVENTIEQESTERGSCSMPSAPTEAVPAEEVGGSDVSKMVEAYIKEHIRPLCKSGVITVDKYRWAVRKATEKVMKYHSKAKNASFLIKEGDKVKKLAEGYVTASQSKDWKPLPSLRA